MKKVFLLVLSEEIPVADADTIDIRMVGSVEKEDGNSLIWFMSGNENQAHYYLPEEKFYPFSFFKK